jgi:hypothetical protein
MRLARISRGLCLALLAGSLSGAPAHAQITVVFDQSFTPDDSFIGNLGFAETLERAQTFTVGSTGVLLEVQLRMLQQQEGDLFFHLLPTQDGVPVEDLGQALASHRVPSGTVPGTVDTFLLDVSASRVEITEGQVLAIVLGADTELGGYSWFGQAPGGYEGGAAYDRNVPGGTWMPTQSSEQAVDFGFATVVAPPFYAKRSWPTSGEPCEDVADLEKCLRTGVAPGAIVEIDADVVPSQTVVVDAKSFTLRPAPGRAPVFQDPFTLVAACGDQDVSVGIEDLSFEGASLRAIQAGAGVLDVTVRGNEIQVPAALGAGIQVSSTNTNPPYGPVRFLVEDNDIDVDVEPNVTASAIVVSGFQADGNTGAIRNNRIHQIGGSASRVIGVGNADVTLEVDIVGNQISGAGYNMGISLQQTGAAASTRALIANNTVSGQVDFAGAPSAISLITGDGSAELGVVGNTLAFNENGLLMGAEPEPGATASAVVANNIFASNVEDGIDVLDFAGELTNEFNLVFGNGSNTFTPGPGTLFVDPLFVAMDDLSLQAGSPARNAGSNAWVPIEVVEDVAGNPRIVDGVVDIGAYELPEPPGGAAALAVLVGIASRRTRK